MFSKRVSLYLLLCVVFLHSYSCADPEENGEATEDAAGFPITGLQSIVEGALEFAKFLESAASMIGAKSGLIVQMLASRIGGELDNITTEISMIPGKIVHGLATYSPPPLGGRIWKDIDNKFRACKTGKPSHFFATTISKGGKCIVKHSREISKNLKQISKKLTAVLTGISDALSQMPDKIEISESTILLTLNGLLKSFISIIDDVSEPLDNLLQLWPKIYLCFWNANYPILKEKFSSNWDGLKCKLEAIIKIQEQRASASM